MRAGVALALVGLLGGLAARAHPPGSHAGIVVEWGDEEYHLRVVVDRKEGTVTVYVYGDDDDLRKNKRKAVDSKGLTLALKTTPPTAVKLQPAPEKDDPAGTSTRFTGRGDVFKTDAKFEGSVSGKVGTKPYYGEFKEK